MAKTAKERVRKWRNKKIKEGGRSLTAWLEPEIAKMFQFLTDYYGESTSFLVARAIKALYKLTLEKESSPKTGSQLLAEITDKLEDGVPFQELKGTLLINWFRVMKAEGVSFKEMATMLNDAKVPTPTGKGKWEEGMIPVLLILSSALSPRKKS